MIVIVDYGMGNLQSVYNALISLGAEAKVGSTPNEINKAGSLILPGVGAFGDTMKGLEKRNLVEPIKKFIASGKYYLGLCLGLQILFEKSEEANALGFGILKGEVKKFKKEKGIKIPHMGWNLVKIRNSKFEIRNKEKILEEDGYFYFVHSYYADPEDKDIIFGKTDYGKTTFASMVAKDNIIATQFHPEKSQKTGLDFLKKFVSLK